MIRFKLVRYKNFLSSGNAFTEIDFLKSRTTLVVGQNGSGKSTILDAICFALYNKAYRNVNKPQLVSSVNRKDMVVEIEFSIGSNDYMIRRGMKPVIFEIFQNGIMMPQDAHSGDYQDYLETFILRMNHKSFCQIGILGTASFTSFMSLPAKDRREVIEDILDLQVFTTMNSILKERMDENKEETRELDTRIKIITEKIAMQERYIQSIQKNTDELIQETLAKLAEYEATIADDLKTVAQNNQKKTELMATADDPQKLSGRLSKIKTLNSQLNTKIKNLQGEIDFYHNNDTCPTCQQGIDHDFKEHKKVSKAQDISITEVALNKIVEEMANTQSNLEKANAIYDECSELNIQNSVAMNAINSYERMILDGKKELARLEARKVNIQNEVNEDGAIEISLPEQLASKENEKSVLLKEKELGATVATFLKDSGVKAKIIKKYIPIINKYINKYLEAMEFAVTFELDATFNEKIKSRHRDEFSYASFSEGEKSRINLAILFTWREIAKIRNSAATNLLIFDEIFDGSLDGQGTEEFMKILNAAAPDSNIIIISHKTDVMLDKFDRAIRFQKVKNFSEMEEI